MTFKIAFRQFSIFALALLTACAASEPQRIEFTGSPGAAVQGYYIRNGKRVELAGPLPITLTDPAISLLAVRKARAEDSLSVSYEKGKDPHRSFMKTRSPAGNLDGIRMDLIDGVSVARILPNESLEVEKDALIVLTPYWYENMWVFDDASRGLVREAFVKGVPDMINALVKDIPDARKGFKLTGSPKPFPGYQKKLTWVRAVDGGNVYRSDDPRMEGWLCPELYRYLPEAPKTLYVKAEKKD